MAADGRITIDFDMDLPSIKSDADRANEVLHGIGSTAGDVMDEKMSKNTEKVKQNAKKASEEVTENIKNAGKSAGDSMSNNFDNNADKVKEKSKETKKAIDNDFSKETKVRIVADAKTAGIKNFETILNKLPKKQQTELLAKVERGEVINYEELLRKIPAKVATQVKLNDNASSGLKSIKRETKQTESRFGRLKDVMLGTFAGGLALSGIHAIVSGLKEATKAGMEYNKEQDTMKTVWRALTTEAPKDGQELINYINSMSQHSIYAASTIDKMAQSFYHVHSSVSETKDWTNAFIRLGSTLHMTNDSLAESGEQFAKIVAGGKASSEDMSVMINRFPMFGEALQKATGKSMKQLYAMSASGKLTATQFTEALDYLSKKYKSGTAEAMTSFQGMSMYISSRWQTLWGDITSTSFNMSKKSRQDIRDLLSDDMMKEYAHGISAALGSVFVWVSKVLGYINDHKKTIVDIIGNLIELLGIIGKSAWNLFADAIYDIAKMLGLVDDSGKKTVDPLKKIDEVLQTLVDHKAAVQDMTKALIAMFAIKKIVDFIKYIKEATVTLGLFQAAESATGGGASKLTTAVTAGETAEGGGTAIAAGSSLIGKVAKASPYLAAGAGVVSELTSNNGTGAKVGGSIGSVGGAAAGAALGTAILPGLGTILGASAGSWVGKKFGEGFGKSLQDSVKGKTIKANVKVSATAKASQIDADKLSKQFEPAIKKLDKKLVVKTSYDPKSMANTQAATAKLYSNMSKSIDSYYKNKEARSKKDLDNLVKQGVMTRKQADDSLKKQTAMDQKERATKQNALKQMQKDQAGYYAQVQNIQNGGTKKLQQIAQKYGVNSEKYEKEKNKELQEAHKNFANAYVKDEYGLNARVGKEVSRGTKEQRSIYDRLVKDKGKLNIQDLKATQKHADNIYKTSVSSARKTRDDVKSAADDQYHKTVATARKEWKEKGTITYAQYKEVKNNAEHQRDDTKSAADSQYRGVTKSAHDQHARVTSEITHQKDDVTKQANAQATNHANAAQGEMTNVNSKYSGGFDGMRAIWNGIASGLNSVLNALHKGWGKIPKIGKHARGASGLSRDEIALVGEEGFELAHNPNRGIFALGTSGPEIRHLEAGTSILPHALSKQFLSMTHGLPAYKHGKSGAITRAYDWLKDKLDDTMSFVSEGAEKAFDFVADKLGLKGFLSNYNAAQHDLMQGASDSTRKGFIDYLKGKFHKYSEDNDGGGGKGAPSGAGVQRWAGQVKEALQANGLSTSAAMVNRVLRQIATESTGNPKAVQPGADPDGDGSGPAIGLMQTKRGTFTANAFPGHGDIFNGYDNLLAALHYAKRSYGPSLGFLGNGHGYANGGWSFMPAIFGEVPGEPEVAINPARDSADEHILQAIQARAVKAPNSTTAQLAQVIENAKDSGQVTPIWGQRASQNIKVAAGDNSHDYTGHLDNVLDKLDTIANKSLEINGHSFSKQYEAYGSARRVQRTQQAQRGLAIDVNI
ncbi:tape measure protein [Loigolactobacillus coryniformis]|uniref:tape measure protein n=1 Tax=Loigolactobacillus coryniformis TaxID=1610 RepID=UPI003F1F624E